MEGGAVIGDNVTLKLIFEDNSAKEITAPVRKIQVEMAMPMGKPGGMMQHNH